MRPHNGAEGADIEVVVVVMEVVIAVDITAGVSTAAGMVAVFISEIHGGIRDLIAGMEASITQHRDTIIPNRRIPMSFPPVKAPASSPRPLCTNRLPKTRPI